MAVVKSALVLMALAMLTQSVLGHRALDEKEQGRVNDSRSLEDK